MERDLLKIISIHNNKQNLHLRLSGGVMANVKLNKVLARALNADSVFIFPNMGDGGLSIGAALAVQPTSPYKLENVYLGSDTKEAACLAALKEQTENLVWVRPKNMASAIAKLLVSGKVIARQAGRMEFGPRALGNRSILYNCSDPSVNQWLNHKLNRSEFMPFAPMCLYEDAHDYFELDPESCTLASL